MIKNVLTGIFSTPVGFLKEMVGKRKVQLRENQNLFKLGRQCRECHKLIVHRDAISICQCYCFTHKDCLINQLNREQMSQCTTIQCGQCKQIVQSIIDYDYSFQPRAKLKDFILLSICIFVCCLAMLYLVSLKNIQAEQFNGQNDLKKTMDNNIKIDSTLVLQVITIGVIFIFGMLFWITLMAILFKRNTRVKNISPTNIDIKVSAFLQIQSKLKQESQQHISLKKQDNQL